MLDYNPSTDLRLYPEPMLRFGTNPHGEALYRIVFAESRRNVVGGRWPDGSAEYRWIPTYRHISEPWVLERWLRPQDFAMCTEQQWELQYRDSATGLLLLGPYPRRGEYQHCHTFTTSVADSNLEKLISWIEEGRTRRWQEHQDACREDYDLDTKDRRERMSAIIRNAMPAYLNNAFVGGAGVKRGTKTAPMTRTANELGLPVGHNKFISLKRRP